MTRVPLIAKPLLAILLLVMVAGNLCAEDARSGADQSTPALQYQRIFVPNSQPELWPVENERYVPVPEAEFQKLLDTANHDLAKTFFTSPEVKVTSADYEAQLQAVDSKEAKDANDSTNTKGNSNEAKKTYRITGKARLQVTTASQTASSDRRFLLLGPASMVVSNLAWKDDQSPVATGVDKQGRLIAEIDRSGELHFDFTARNRTKKPGELRFDLMLPRSTRSAVRLVLDSNWNLSVSTGLLLAQKALDPEPASNQPSKQTRWTTAPALDGQLGLHLTKKQDPSALAEIPDVVESMVYDFSPRGLELHAELRLSTTGPMLPASLRLELEKPLTLISARLGSEPLEWSAQSEGDQKTVLLQLPEFRARRATLRLRASCAISENIDWRLPRIIPQDVFWRSGQISLQVHPPLSIGKLAPCQCVRSKIEEITDGDGRQIRLTSFRRNATAVVSLGWEKRAPTLSTGTVVDLSGVDISATQSLLFIPSDEDVFELRAAVNSDWIIDSVESSTNGAIADWRVETTGKRRNQKNTLLIVRLANALSKPRGPLRLTLSARCLQSPLDKRLALKDLIPVEFRDVRPEHRLISIATVDPYSVIYRGEEFVDSLSIKSLSAEQGTLFSKIPVGKIFVDNARAARLEVVLEEQQPAYAATVDMLLTLTKTKVTERYRFRCVPEASHIERLLIHLSGEEDKSTGQEKEKGTLHFLPKPLASSFASFADKRPAISSGILNGIATGIINGAEEPGFLPLSPKSFSVVKLSPEEQAAIGMGAGGQTWEITLKSPQNEPFELYAIRSQDYSEAREAVLPMTICPSLAAMPEAVEHHAALQIQATDDTALWLRNHRLDPIPAAPSDPRTIQQLRAAFRYETTDALASPSDPALCLTLDKPMHTSLLAWKCVVQTEFGGDGRIKATARYDLENQGEARFRLLVPKKTSPLVIDAISLDGKYVDWTPDYTDKEATGSDSRLVSIGIDLPQIKRFPSVVVHYSYRIRPLDITQLRSLVAPKPECEVVSVDWRFLLPPGYKASDYVAINDLPAQTVSFAAEEASNNQNQSQSQNQNASLGIDSVLSPRKTFCWRTCLFGPLGRSTSDMPFNPLSLTSWARLFNDLEPRVHAASPESVESISNPQDPTVAKTKVDSYRDWNLYQLRYSSFDRPAPVRIVHRDSIEVFRWTAFLVTIAVVAWPRSARWVRRLPVAIAAALFAIFMSPFLSSIASGVMMAVLLALFAMWLLRDGHGRSRFQRPTSPDRTEGLVSATAKSSPLNSSGSTQTNPAIHTRPIAPEASDEKDITPTEHSTGTRIELGKAISDKTNLSAPTPEPKTTPPQEPGGSGRSGGSTIIRRTTMLWALLVGLLLSGRVDAAFFQDPTTPTSTPTPSASSRTVKDAPNTTVSWPILIPTDPAQAGTDHAGAMFYLPESFFQELEVLARRQTAQRDLWLLKNISLRAILDRGATKAIHPTFLFLQLELSAFSQNVEVEIPLKKEEVEFDKTRSTLDGRPVLPRWSEDGESLIVPVSGRGPHQLDLIVTPLPDSHATRWNRQEQCDESGFRIHFPSFSQIHLELNHPTDMICPTIEGMISSKEEGATTMRATIASEGHFAVWWPEEKFAQRSAAASKFDELLLLDVAPEAVTLQANWSLASASLDTAKRNGPDAKAGKQDRNQSQPKNRSIVADRGTARLRDVTLSVDPQLVLQELSSGFTLRSIPGSPDKRRLCWNKVTDPPKSVQAKFSLRQTRGIGQFHAPTLHIDQGQTVRHWLAIRVASGLQYQADLSKPSSSPIACVGSASDASASDASVSTITPEAFMAAWQEKLATAGPRNSLTETVESPAAPALPDLVVTDPAGDWSFQTEPKPTDAAVVHQTLRVSFGETSTSIRFEAEWSSGSHDMPEPSLRVPKNFRIESADLIDGEAHKNLRWSCTREGFVHLATGLLPPKHRTIRIEGTLEAVDTSRPVPLPILSLVGSEETPIHVGIYRKPDALLALKWKGLPLHSEPPESITDDRFQGQAVQWLKQKPAEESAVEVRITPNRPTIRARQVVTIDPSPSAFPSVSSVSDPGDAENLAEDADTEKQQHDMIAAFELTPSGGVIDEIAIFVPHNVPGPFRIDPPLDLNRSHENEKGSIIVFQPKEPIKKWHQFRISSPMLPGETRIPDVKLCEVDNLQRYVVLPAGTGETKRQKWQTRLLNREPDQAILGKLMPIPSGAQLYRIVGRQWLATTSTSERSDQQPIASLADIKVRWQEDGSYLASAVFDLKPSGNESCRLIVPRDLTLLDARIAGIPVSPAKIDSNHKGATQKSANSKASKTLHGAYKSHFTSKTLHDAYKIHFTSKTLPQRVELLYQYTPPKQRLGEELASQSRVLRKDFQAPFLDIEIQQTCWTVQGPDSYTIQGNSGNLDVLDTLDEAMLDNTPVASLTPFLTAQASLGKPVRWTVKGFSGSWKTVWLSHAPSTLATLTPIVLVLLSIGILAFLRPVHAIFLRLLHRHRPFFGIGLGLFWWLFLTPSILGWAIIIAFLIVLYRTRNRHPQSGSSPIPIG